MLARAIDFMGNVLGQSVFDRVFRRWDGKNLSRKGTIGGSFRLVSGSEPGLTNRWRSYLTAVSSGHVWIGRTSVNVVRVDAQQRRAPRRRDLLSADSVIIPVTTASGAELEWALRASQVDAVLRCLGTAPLA